MDVLMEEAATATDERLNEVEEPLDAAITVNEGRGSCSFCSALVRTRYH